MKYPVSLLICVILLFALSICTGKSVTDRNDEILMSGAGESEELPPLRPIPPLSSLLPSLNKGDTRKLKDILFRKVPVFEEMLRKKEKRVLEVADNTFTLQFASLPVKKLTEVDDTSSEEVLETRAFETLSGIVARLVQDVLACSNTDIDDAANITSICSTLDLVGNDKPTQDDETTNDCDGSDEDCEIQGRSAARRPPRRGFPATPLNYRIYIHNTHRPTYTKQLPSNGRLDDIGIWDNEAPTKLLLTLIPYEFNKRAGQERITNQQMIYAYNHRYGFGSQNHNIVELRFPEIWRRKLSVVSIASRLVPTADQLATLIARWHKKGQINLEELHIIGFSAGAHLAGIIGQKVKKLTGGEEVCRITGLDPLGWGFDTMDDGKPMDPSLTLTRDDAKLVDVIHTSTPDTAFPFIHYGTNENRGSVDFYPNNGRAQYCGPTDGIVGLGLS
ncbi:unnamed protein product [Orchesella dallaii]|uniref:Lipase domain-containing protein n=1 Tax=Orchesella dallaii TaxID=48710 RepID=A0ABP1RDN5_9HEXA